MKHRVLAALVAVAIVASAVAPMVALTSGPAAAAASGPSDMVALGDAQVSEDLPADADVPIRASDLEGNVWASDHADTLEVIVTTPDRADEYVDTSGSNILEGDDVALIVADSETHAGRDIAVGAQLLEDALGYQPEAAFGLHSSGEEWSSEISYDGGAAVFEVPKFSENTVSFSGGITLSGSNAVDGTSYSYDLGSLDGVDNFAVNLTGRRLTQDEHRTASTSSGSLSVDAGGTTAPENAEVVIEGQRQEDMNSKAVSDGSSVTVDGNTAPESESITIEGAGSVTDRSESYSGLTNGASRSVTVDGSQNTNMDVTFTGSTRTQSRSASTGSGSGSITADSSAQSVNSESASVSGGSYTNWHDEDQPTARPVYIEYDMNTQYSKTVTLEFWDSNDNYLDFIEFTGEGSLFITESDIPSGSAYIKVGHATMDSYYIRVTNITEATVSTPSQTKSKMVGDYSESIAIDVAPGETVDYSVSGPGSVDVGFDEIYHSDPSATIDGSTVDPGTDLSEGQTATETITVNPGSTGIDVSTTEPVDLDLSWTEDTRSYDPSVTIDGSTVSHSGALGSGETETGAVDLSTGAHTVSVSSTGSIGGATANWTEVTRSENPSVEIAGETIAHAGVLDVGQTTRQSISLPLGSSTASISSSGPVCVNVSWTEVSETTNAGISVNGNERTIDGTIPAGQTESLPADEAWLKEGTNNVSVVTADAGSGPAPEVGLEYQHEAGATSIDETVKASTWKESYNVSHTFPSQQTSAEARLGYAPNVIDIRNLEMRTNGGSWQSVSESDYSLKNSTLVVDLGDVAADTTVDIRATGGKIQTYDGAVDIVKPTAEGDQLATEIEVTEVASDGMLGIDVSETAVEDRVHYSTGESFEGSAHAEVTASGDQILRAPDANAGSTMTIETLPASVAPESGAMEVEIEQDGSEPRFRLRQGNTVGASNVEVGYYDTLSGDRYVLWSETQDREVDSDRAESPVFFATDGSSETYSILQRDAPQSGGGGAAPAAAGGGLSLSLILPAVAISVGGLWWAGRRFGGARGVRGNSVLLVGASILAVVAAELVTPRSLTSDLIFALSDSLAGGAGAVILSVLLVVGLWQINERTSADVPWWVMGVGGFGAVVLSAEAIRPGSVLGALEGALSEVGAAVILLGIIVLGAVLWRRASTPNTEVTIDGGSDE